MPNLRIEENLDALNCAYLPELIKSAQRAIDERGRFLWVLSGGSTPKKLLSLLAEPQHQKQIAWDRVHLFWGDERHVPPSHPESNYRMAKEALISRVPIPESNVHRIIAENADAFEVARDYQARLDVVVGAGPSGFPQFDVVLLGMGPDGHTASLFPGTDIVKNGCVGWVSSVHVEKFEADRITLCPGVFNAAREVNFLIAGADKAPALRAVLEGPVDPLTFPSQLIHPRPGCLTFWVEKSATSLLRSV